MGMLLHALAFSFHREMIRKTKIRHKKNERGFLNFDPALSGVEAVVVAHLFLTGVKMCVAFFLGGCSCIFTACNEYG